jgi:glutamate receptor, ionotropic, invertebrate
MSDNKVMMTRFGQTLWTTVKSCSSSLSWRLQAHEMKVLNQPTLLEVAQWDGLHGLIVYDDMFPHVTGGLRGRRITVTTLEVGSLLSSFLLQVTAIISRL